MTSFPNRDAIVSLLNNGRANNADVGKYQSSIRAYLDNYPDDTEIASASIALQEEYLDRQLNACICIADNFTAADYKVAALVSAYESQAFIGECLSDLLGQSIGDAVEIIVIDAASPQDERGIVNGFQKQYTNIRYFRTPSRIGIYEAWNLGIRASGADFIIPASTNDRLGPDACRVLADTLAKNAETMLVYGDCSLTDKPHQQFGRHAPSTHFGGAWRWPDYSFVDLLNSCRVGPHPMWRKHVHKQIGYFDTTYSALGDQDMWLRIGRKWPIVHIPNFTGLAWLSKASLSGNDAVFQKEIQDIRFRHQNLYLSSIHREKFPDIFPAQNIRALLQSGADYGWPDDKPFELAQFVDTIIALVEKGRNADAKRYYNMYRCLFPSSAQTEHFDELIANMK